MQLAITAEVVVKFKTHGASKANNSPELATDDPAIGSVATMGDVDASKKARAAPSKRHGSQHSSPGTRSMRDSSKSPCESTIQNGSCGGGFELPRWAVGVCVQSKIRLSKGVSAVTFDRLGTNTGRSKGVHRRESRHNDKAKRNTGNEDDTPNHLHRYY